MFTVSRRQLRIACILVAILVMAAFICRWAEYHGYLGSIARNAGTWRYQGLWMPIWLLSLLGFIHLAVLTLGLVGTFMFRKWGRSLLAVALLLAFAVAPLSGEAVYSPLTMLLGSAVTLLHAWMVTVAYWSVEGRSLFAGTTGLAV